MIYFKREKGELKDNTLKELEHAAFKYILGRLSKLLFYLRKTSILALSAHLQN